MASLTLWQINKDTNGFAPIVCSVNFMLKNAIYYSLALESVLSSSSVWNNTTMWKLEQFSLIIDLSLAASYFPSLEPRFQPIAVPVAVLVSVLLLDNSSRSPTLEPSIFKSVLPGERSSPSQNDSPSSSPSAFPSSSSSVLPTAPQT